MPLQATSGAASYDAFGGGVAAVPQYIEDVFSTFVYAGNSTNRSIVNDIDLSGKGGLVWIKDRNFGLNHTLFDTARGATKFLSSDNTNAEGSASNTLTAFNSNGFNLGTNSGYVNGSGYNYVSWTFREQAKFFDVVTYTGNSVAGREIAHNLGSVPGCMIVKSTSDTQDWAVYHRSLGNTKRLVLNGTDAEITSIVWNNTTPTSTVFTVSDNARVNSNGSTYVAYLFAHDAGGFGLTGTDNVISCGSFDANNGEVINLGYEPQWLLYKDSVSVSNWRIADTMRGLTNLAGTNAYTIQQLVPNSSAAEGANSGPVLTSTGFTWNQSGGGNKHIYIAIRRGPMKVPTTGTSVFTTRVATEVEYNNTADYGITTDLLLNRYYKDGSQYTMSFDRLRGSSKILYTPLTDAEGSLTLGAGNLGFGAGQTSVTWAQIANSSVSNVTWAFRRAPSFFDEVCYTGTGVANTAFTHNLTVTPELMIVKPRSAATAPNWRVWSPINSTDFNLLQLSTDGAASSSLYSSSNVFPAIPTATTFTVGGSGSIQLNESGQTFVAYLFATCAGVSKVTTFTGNGSSQTINCGFTGGARFVLIKRVDSTGNWVTFDTARGIVSGNDPALYLNSTAAEVTGVDAIDPDSTGFIVNQESTFNLNVSSATYLVLAIA